MLDKVTVEELIDAFERYYNVLYQTHLLNLNGSFQNLNRVSVYYLKVYRSEAHSTTQLW